MGALAGSWERTLIFWLIDNCAHSRWTPENAMLPRGGGFLTNAIVNQNLTSGLVWCWTSIYLYNIKLFIKNYKTYY